MYSPGLHSKRPIWSSLLDPWLTHASYARRGVPSTKPFVILSPLIIRKLSFIHTWFLYLVVIRPVRFSRKKRQENDRLVRAARLDATAWELRRIVEFQKVYYVQGATDKRFGRHAISRKTCSKLAAWPLTRRVLHMEMNARRMLWLFEHNTSKI